MTHARYAWTVSYDLKVSYIHVSALHFVTDTLISSAVIIWGNMICKSFLFEMVVEQCRSCFRFKLIFLQLISLSLLYNFIASRTNVKKICELN